MKRIMTLSILAIFFAIAFSACEKEKKICDNFAKQGISDKNALIGEWKFECFGYTINGNTIRKKRNKIDKKISVSFYEWGMFSLHYWNNFLGPYTTNNTNEITIIIDRQTELLPPVANQMEEAQKEIDFSKYFSNAICYKIDNENLYIHTKKVNGYNVLILKKGE